MAAKEHNDSFTINDITFNVPPTEISIQKQAANFEWQTLRTKNAQKVKSGHGTIHISFTAAFVGLIDINTKLRPLICQLRLTPICYVENSYLRQHLLPTDSDQNMALILKSMAITTRPELVDTVIVNFEFGWFNFLPYAQRMKFKRDLNNEVPQSVSSPAESKAWSAFYETDLNTVGKYVPLKEFRSDMEFQFNEYRMGPKNEFDSVEKTTEYINGQRKILEATELQLFDVQSSEDLPIMVMGPDGVMSTSSKGSVNDPVIALRQSEIDDLKAKIERVEGIRGFLEGNEGFLPLKNSDGVHLEFETGTNKNLAVYFRPRSVACNAEAQLICTGMTIVFENIVAALPVLGHQYSTYQHIGSIDPKIVIRLMANTDDARRQITGTWEAVENNAIRFRNVLKQEILNMRLVNDMTRLCGINTFITDALSDETIPGQPGTYALTLSMRGTDFTEPEKLVQEFVTSNDVRRKILETLRAYVHVIKTEPFGRLNHKFVINFSKEDSRAYLVDNVDRFATNVNIHAINIMNSIVFGLAAAGNPETSKTLLNIIMNSSESENPELALLKELIVPSLTSQEALKSGFFTGFQNPANNLLEQIEFTSSLDKFELNAIGDIIGTNQKLTRVDQFPELVAYITELNASLDNLTVDGTLELEEFTDARLLADKAGVFRGRRAYPDFQILEQIAATLKKNELDVDPDFYFYSDLTDKIESIIDPGLFQTAQDTAKRLYVQGPSETKGLFDKVSNYFENVYMNRIGEGDLKKQLADTKHLASIKRPASNVKLEVPVGEYANTSGFEGRAINNYTTTNKASTNLLPVDKVQHIIALKTAIHSTEPSFVFDGNRPLVTDNGTFSDEVFNYPVTPVNIVSGYQGLDFSVPVGTAVRASKGGVVTRAGLQNPNNDQVGFGNRIRLLHDDGFTTVYAHLSEILVADNDRVAAGQIIAKSGGAKGAKGAGTSTGPHLHFEIINKDLVHENPADFLGVATQTNTAIPIIPRGAENGEGFQFGTSLFSRSVESMVKDLSLGQANRMVRAYPTFKLYFVEEDTLDERFFGFDDFFSYSAVKSIRVVRSRKIAADLCVIELTNVSGILSNRKFRETGERNKKGEDISQKERTSTDGIAKEDPRNINAINTADENPLASIMLKEGTRMHLRLGYSNDPDKLEDVFVGQITEVEFNETDDLITIVGQSYAIELEQQIKGLQEPVERGGWLLGTNNAATGQLLSDMLQQPEVLHFGRWIRSRLLGVSPTNTNLDLLTNRFEWLPVPQDDNIFPPLLDQINFTNNVTGVFNFLIDQVGGPLSLQFNGLNYYIYKTTIWEIFKEMELRHPGCISSPVPYIDSRQGPRMTMFFGLPNQLYFARDPSLKEKRISNTLTETIRENEVDLQLLNEINDVYGLDRINESGKDRSANELFASRAAFETKKRRSISQYEKHVRKHLALKDKSIKPFRAYHVLTSNNHIVSNSIRASSMNVYNTVSLEFSDNGWFYEATGPGAGSAVIVEGDKLLSTEPNVLTMKADAALPDSEVQEMFLQFPSCEGKTMAEYYCLGALKNSLRDIYKGELVIIGNPSIKPYDICYVFDEYSDIVGPIEVEQVVHYFSQESGFVTEIVPDICVTINEWTTLATMDGLGMIAEGVINNVFGRDIVKAGDNKTSGGEAAAAVSVGVSLPVLAALAPATIPLGLVGAFCTYKFIDWSKFRHPVTLSPLMYKGKPLIAGMGNKVIANTWVNNLNEWYADGLEGISLTIRDLADRMVIGPSTGSLRNLGLITMPTQY